MSIADPITVLKMELQQNAVPQIIDLLSASLQDGRPLHEVEGGLWDLVLQVGRLSLGAFLDRHGTGDLGEAVTLPDGHEAHRLEGLHTRRYVSIFGAFTLQRTVYGSRQGQALEFVPLDPHGRAAVVWRRATFALSAGSLSSSFPISLSLAQEASTLCPLYTAGIPCACMQPFPRRPRVYISV